MKLKSYFLATIILLTIGFLLGTIFGLVIGIKITNQNKERELVSSTVILDKIKSQSFLVTRTIVTDQETTITVDQGSAWSNFWWGHEITANGLMQVDVGVDLTKLDLNDIEVNNDKKEIKINLPEAEVYNTSLEGDIEVSTKSGILKILFDSDDNEDFNLALRELSKQAEDAISQDKDLMNEARSSALSTLQVILNDTGYIVIEK